MKNFGKIKNAFNNILVEGIVKNDDTKKSLFKSYIKTIKENEVLKTQFLVYNNLETKIESNEFKATEFVKENIALFDAFDKKDIDKLNESLSKDIVLDEVEYGTHKLHECISMLISESKNAKNLDSLLEAQSYIVNYIMNNKAKEITEAIELPMSMISSVFIDKYNEKYGVLSELEREALKVVIESSDDDKQVVYGKTIRECIDLIDTKLPSSDIDAKDKLLKVKDRLLNDKSDVMEDFIPKFSKLIELRNNLLEN